ncbi:uncharacterized protein M421DRAFT_361158 [Didymella exigua CBS 183.55]|uniref:Uncharacterized protein n=1 Tax=Didymella exigua CBS 183.55 TaxID=1150837 RepID=A0A6A5RR82_9PLEO|nr:uncharacterized protein M421DRAFT_361158 [Didymella exigua CBS 183.55]KAF1930855.1 hypothetical protein M421DRAFT_361158 [Didymella exigua CBS 183.55]
MRSRGSRSSAPRIHLHQCSMPTFRILEPLREALPAKSILQPPILHDLYKDQAFCIFRVRSSTSVIRLFQAGAYPGQRKILIITMKSRHKVRSQLRMVLPVVFQSSVRAFEDSVTAGRDTKDRDRPPVPALLMSSVIASTVLSAKLSTAIWLPTVYDTRH